MIIRQKAKEIAKKLNSEGFNELQVSVQIDPTPRRDKSVTLYIEPEWLSVEFDPTPYLIIEDDEEGFWKDMLEYLKMQFGSMVSVVKERDDNIVVISHII